MGSTQKAESISSSSAPAGSSKKALSHTRILKAASQVMREQGYAGAGLQKIMKVAGMTVGGFYSHFSSKEFLFARVISETFRQTREKFSSRLTHVEGKEWIAGLIGHYLSLEHRNDIADGCPMPALISEIPRAGATAQKVYEKELLVSLERFRERLGEKNNQNAEIILAMLVGGISMARAVQDEKLADEILQSCRKAALQFTGLGDKNENVQTISVGN